MENVKTTKSGLNTWAMTITFTGVFLFGAKAIFVKLCYQEGINANTMIMLRMCAALPFYLVILLWGKNWQVFKSISTKDHITIIVLGMIGYYLSSFFDFLGLQYITASLERLILFAYPTLVVLLSAIFLKKKMTRDQIIAIIVTYLGLVITMFENIHMEDSSNIYLGCALIFGSALTYAIYLIGSGQLLNSIGTLVFTSYSMIVSAICVIINSFVFPVKPLAEIPPVVYGYGLVVSIFCTILPSFMISYAIKQVGASKVSIAGSIGPVFTIFLSYYILHETLSVYQIVGGAVILMGVFWISVKKS